MTNNKKTYIQTYTKSSFDNLELLRSWLEQNYSLGQGHERLAKHEQRKIHEVFAELRDVKYIGTPEKTYLILDKEDYMKNIMNASLEDVFSSVDISLGNVFDEDKQELHSEYPKKKLNPQPNEEKQNANENDFNQKIKRQIINLNNCATYLSNEHLPDIILN